MSGERGRRLRAVIPTAESNASMWWGWCDGGGGGGPARGAEKNAPLLRREFI
jgi:hypothetical protein